ncbi:MAG TPA: hypothetical protein VGO18_18720 [Steroidobacteraceae bacterium]|jgi:hypothetical protein|nr:hypothetical protein [Steroidobacteraceae bacterium]
MKAANMSMGARARRARLSLTLLAAGLTAISVGTAIAQDSPPGAVVRAQRAGPSPRVVSKAHQPVGTPHKASSFAPHPTKRRVFGDPIQPPILGHVQPPKKAGPK